MRQRVSNYEPTVQKPLTMGVCRDWRVRIGRESGGFELQEVRFGSNKGQDCANMACYSPRWPSLVSWDRAFAPELAQQQKYGGGGYGHPRG